MDKRSNLIGYPAVITLTALITYFYFNSTKTDLYPANDDPHNIIDFREIQDLYYRYDERVKLIDSAERKTLPQFNAARSITFNYQELKNYLKAIEKNSSQAKVRIKGLRFYYGKFSDSAPGNKKARQMLFFNPTIDTLLPGSKEKVELAYAIMRQGNKVSVKFLKDIIKHPRSSRTSQQNIQNNEASALSFLNFNTTPKLESQAENGGQQSPPPFDMQ